MSTSCAAQGAQSKLLVKSGASTYDFTTGAERYEFNVENIRKQQRVVGGRGIRGTRSKSAARLREGSYSVGGPISIDPSPNMLANWLPRILGGTASSGSFPLAESLPSFGVLLNRVGGVFEYQDGYVNQAVLEARSGPSDNGAEIVALEMNLAFKTEKTDTTWPESPTALGTSAADNFYIFSDVSCTLASKARSILRTRLMFDNHLQTLWTNSLSPTCITPRDRTVSVAFLLPFTSDEMTDLYGNQIPGGAASLTLTNGDFSTAFAFDNLTIPSESPAVRGKQAILMWVVGTAYDTGDGEIEVTNDSTAA